MGFVSALIFLQNSENGARAISCSTAASPILGIAGVQP
jgi:hypothetical protein